MLQAAAVAAGLLANSPCSHCNLASHNCTQKWQVGVGEGGHATASGLQAAHVPRVAQALNNWQPLGGRVDQQSRCAHEPPHLQRKGMCEQCELALCMTCGWRNILHHPTVG